MSYRLGDPDHCSNSLLKQAQHTRIQTRRYTLKRYVTWLSYNKLQGYKHYSASQLDVVVQVIKQETLNTTVIIQNALNKKDHVVLQQGSIGDG